MDRGLAVAVITVYLVVTAIGWFGNSCIIVATILSRKLHGPCNSIIAFESFCELFHQAAHVITAYYIYSGNYFITTSQCFTLQMIPNFFMNAGSFLNLSIGFDRLFSILFPVFYMGMNKIIYVIVLCSPAVGYGAGLMVFTYFKAEEREVVCTIAAVYAGYPQYVFAVLGSALNISIILVYLVLWLILRKKGVASQSTKLVKSLTIIVACFAFGWVTTMVTFSLNAFLEMRGEISFYTIMIAGIFVNCSVACNFFVLNVCSIEYRQAFRSIMNLKLPVNGSQEVCTVKSVKGPTEVHLKITSTATKTDKKSAVAPSAQTLVG